MDINDGVKEFESCPGAVLLDVRNPGEFADGHIPGSVNLPLMQLPRADEVIDSLDTPIYVYCLSGGRSNRAVAFLQEQGYTNVQNIGGIKNYTGQLEK